MNEHKYQEVEIKFKLLNVDTVKNQLAKLSAIKILDSEYQCDTYYVPFHRDFFKEDIVSEWLRLRETNNKNQLNYKRWLPLGVPVQTHCEEYETDISDINALRCILEYMNFKEVIKVEKYRNSWKYNNIIICLDEVAELGTFIELEYAETVQLEVIDQVCKFMNNFLVNELAAKTEQRDRRGYPYQMMALKGIIP